MSNTTKRTEKEIDGILNWITDIENSAEKNTLKNLSRVQALRIALLKMSERRNFND